MEADSSSKIDASQPCKRSAKKFKHQKAKVDIIKLSISSIVENKAVMGMKTNERSSHSTLWGNFSSNGSSDGSKTIWAGSIIKCRRQLGFTGCALKKQKQQEQNRCQRACMGGKRSTGGFRGQGYYTEQSHS